MLVTTTTTIHLRHPPQHPHGLLASGILLFKWGPAGNWGYFPLVRNKFSRTSHLGYYAYLSLIHFQILPQLFGFRHNQAFHQLLIACSSVDCCSKPASHLSPRDLPSLHHQLGTPITLSFCIPSHFLYLVAFSLFTFSF